MRPRGASCRIRSPIRSAGTLGAPRPVRGSKSSRRAERSSLRVARPGSVSPTPELGADDVCSHAYRLPGSRADAPRDPGAADRIRVVAGRGAVSRGCARLSRSRRRAEPSRLTDITEQRAAESGSSARSRTSTRAGRRLLHRLEDECLAGRIAVAQRDHPASRIASTGSQRPQAYVLSGCGRATTTAGDHHLDREILPPTTARPHATPTARTSDQAVLISRPGCPPSLCFWTVRSGGAPI